jgi:hypothetical protein
MRTSQLVTSYIQAVIFMALGVRSVSGWFSERDRRSGHLAVAAGLFGLQSLISAVDGTVWNSAKAQTPPRALSVFTSILLLVAVYAFLLFLSDFIAYPRWIHGLLILSTLTTVVFTIIERPDLRFDPQKGIVPIPGIHNPINYRTYIGYLLVYLAIAFGVLAFAFLVYGFRAEGLARFRMLSIGSGFLLFFIVIGLLPRLLFGNPSAHTIQNLINFLQYVALLVAPLLLVGFAPPKFIRSRFSTT